YLEEDNKKHQKEHKSNKDKIAGNETAQQRNGNGNRTFFRKRSSGLTQSISHAPSPGNRSDQRSQTQGTPRHPPYGKYGK
ncbi:hypothetical protein HAX54_039091, partial [Datura stramonium]|nr:hypothetical protein [Datura stramonium]